MALEDCEVLARLLAHYQDQSRDGWRLAAKAYSDMRIPRLRWVSKEARKRGAMKQDMGIVQEMLMYFFIWLSGRSRGSIYPAEAQLNQSLGKIGLFTRYDRLLSKYDILTEVQKVVDQRDNT